MDLIDQAKPFIERYLDLEEGLDLRIIARELEITPVELNVICKKLYGKLEWRLIQKLRYNALDRKRKCLS